MGKFLRLSNGVPRSFDEASSLTIYDETLEVVASGAGAGQINGPISAGTSISLPNSQTYTAGELEVYLSGNRLTYILDYAYVSGTQVSFTFQLEVKDFIRFRIDRGP